MEAEATSCYHVLLMRVWPRLVGLRLLPKWLRLGSSGGVVAILEKKKRLVKYLQEHFNTREGKRSRWSNFFGGSHFGTSREHLGWIRFILSVWQSFTRGSWRNRWKSPTKHSVAAQILYTVYVRLLQHRDAKGLFSWGKIHCSKLSGNSVRRRNSEFPMNREFLEKFSIN